VAPLAAAGIDIDLDADDDDVSLPPETEAILFRAALESLRNVLRHADAGRVSVRVSSPDGHVTLDVEDDGRGFLVDDATRDGHFGLRLLEDLARDTDGRLTVRSRPGEGTSIRLEIPLP
jgi:signal transduction histidine kinase